MGRSGRRTEIALSIDKYKLCATRSRQLVPYNTSCVRSPVKIGKLVRSWGARVLVRGRELVVDLSSVQRRRSFSRRLAPFGPGARARLYGPCAGGSRAGARRRSGRTRPCVAMRARRARQGCHGGWESAKAKRRPDDSPFAAAQEWARANNGNVDTEIERHATHAHQRINSCAPFVTRS